jgi:hypothetical protein
MDFFIVAIFILFAILFAIVFGFGFVKLLMLVIFLVRVNLCELLKVL